VPAIRQRYGFGSEQPHFPLMLHFLQRADISAERWDACVAASSQRILYAYSWYLDTVCENWGAVVEQAGGRYVSVFPLPFKQTIGVRRIYQPFFTQQLGLFTTASSQYQRLSDYLDCIPGGFWKIFLQLNTANTQLPLPDNSGFHRRMRTTFHLPLDQPYPLLAEKYSSNLVRNLKKARSQGYAVGPSDDIGSLVQLFRETKGKEVRELQDQDYLRLQQLYGRARSREAAQVLAARQEGKVVAGAFFLISPGKTIYLFGAASAQAKQTGAMALLLDFLIQQRAGSAHLLDFEGSDLPGVARFYASFGAQPVSYVSLSQTNLPWYLKWIT
jgi:hypothetical protein